MISLPLFVFKLFFFLYGLLIGSFLNVLIYRLPREMNIAYPRSSCTNCRKLIYWYENIPVISYLMQNGRCSGCGERISGLYPFVEILTAFFSLWLAPNYVGAEVFIYYFFYFSIICIFIVHFIVDLKHQILPNSLNFILLAIFVAYGIVFHHWTFWVYGGAIGFIAPLTVTWLFYLLTKKVGMGGGDIKLYGCLGVYLGPIGIIYNISLSCLLGAIVGGGWLLVSKKGKNEPIPFGPFIIIAGFLQIFFPKFLQKLLLF